MSIETEITRLQNAKASLKTSLISKGVEVSDTAKLDEYPALVDSIEAGGGTTLWAGGGNPVLIKKIEDVVNLANDTNFNSITPSSSAQQIYAGKTLISATLDTKNYDYVIISRLLIDIAYTDDIPSEYKYIKRKMYEYVYNAGKMYYVNNKDKVNNTQSIFSKDATLYNNGASGEAYSTSYISTGIYNSSTKTPYVSQSGDSPSSTISENPISVKSDSTYMQPESFNYIDASNTNIIYRMELYQVDKGTAPYVVAQNELVDSLNNGSLD